ncbi:MAG: ECF transporter S component [Clostridia bacterium]|nr:ECF transporter S component [Clostridia bacterium]
MSETSNRNSTRRLTLMAMLAAIAYAAMLITRPLPAVAGFLSYDLKDVIIAIAGFLLGPAAALIITAVVSLIEMVTVSSTGPIGLLMNVLSTAAFALPPSLMYRRERTLKNAALGLGLGVALMTAMMLAWNYIVTPMYMGVPRQVVAGMLLPTFLPFNLVKGGLNAGITMLLYKPLSAALKKTGLLPRQGEVAKPRRFSPAATLISALVVVTCVVVFILMTR